MSTTERDAIRAVVEFVDNEATSIVQALDAMAQACDRHEQAARVQGQIAVARVCRESAAAWRAKSEHLARLWSALPDPERF